MPTPLRLRFALFVMRLGVFSVMAMWSLDKILYPDHAAGVFENFYFIADLGAGILLLIGLIQLLIELAFLAGIGKTWTYGFVLLTHTVSVLSSWRQYLDPFDNMLFLAAIPMLSACVALFLLRREDTLLTLGGQKDKAGHRYTI